MTKIEQKTNTWRKVKLGALGLDISDGNYSSKYPKKSDFVKDGVPFIRADNIRDGRVVWSDMKYISPAKHHELQKGHLKKNDILITTRGEIGKIARVDDEFIDSNINAQIVRINTKKVLDSRYFFYYLWDKSRKGFFQSIQTGTALQQLPVGQLRSVDLELPENIIDQKRIADVLSAFDDKIELNNKISAALEQMAQAIFKEWLLKYQILNIKKQKLSELVKIISGNPFSSKLYVNDEKAFGVVTIKNVQDGNFITSCDSFIKDENIPKNMNQECMLNDGDILLSLTGNVGRVCFVYGGKYLLNQRVAKLKPKSEKDSAFCYFLFRQTSMQNQLINMAKGSAQPNLSPVETGGIELAIPPRELLDKFSELAGPIYERLIKNAVENQKLAALRDLLLSKLMSGEIRV